MKSHCLRVHVAVSLILLAATVIKTAVAVSEADAIRIEDPCAAELGLTTQSDNLACVPIGEGDLAPRCFNLTNLCDGEQFCSNGNDEGSGFSSATRITCDVDNRMFHCSSEDAVSIELARICDGNKDCSKGEDERFILCKNKCRGSYYGGCPITRRCESSNDTVTCGDCFSGYVTDPNSPTGDCLPVISISFESSAYTVTEGLDQQVEVCVNATATRIKSQQLLNVMLVITSGFRATTADYITPSATLRNITLTKNEPRVCLNISIVDDLFVEDTETFAVSLRNIGGDQIVLVKPNTTTVTILDRDVIKVGFTDTCYPVDEVANVCLDILNNIQIQTSLRPTISLARSTGCNGLSATFQINDTVGSRACSNIGPNFAIGTTCQNITLVQSCQAFQGQRNGLFTFQNGLSTQICTTVGVESNSGSCAEENVTANSTTFIWPRTTAGTKASFTCPSNPRFFVTRECMACMRASIWRDFERDGCGILTSVLANISSLPLTSQNDVNTVIQRLATAIMESAGRPVDQTETNLQTTATIINNVVNYYTLQGMTNTTVNDTVITASTQIVNYLIQWTPTVVEATTSSSLIQSFEALSSLYAEQLSMNSTQSISFDSLTLITQLSDFEDLQAGRSIAIDGQNFTIENRIKTSPSETTIPAISLPPSIFQRIDSSSATSSTGLVFALYRQPTLFPIGSNVISSTEDNSTMTKVGSQVIAARIGQSDEIFENLQDPITVLLPIESITEGNLIAGSEVCMSWDFDLSDWTRRGCTTSVGGNGVVTCTCNHLTNFAVLVDICLRQEGCQPVNPVVEFIHSFVSYIGTIISIIGLILTIITMLVFKKLRQKDVTGYHIQLCLSLLLMLVMALVLISVSSTGVHNILYGGCIFISTTVHYFTLVAVLWMAAEALLMFQKVVLVFVRITVTQLVIVSLICWLVPIAPVLATLIGDQVLGTDPANDIIIRRAGSESFCFLSHAGAFWGAFLGPILLILICNVVVFICVIVVLIRHIRSTSSRTKQGMETKKIVRLVFSIGGVMALFGLTWLFAIFTVSFSGQNGVFQILFTIFNSFQGFFIFLFFCVLNKEARDSWKELFRSKYTYKSKKDSSQIAQTNKLTLSSAVETSSVSPDNKSVDNQSVVNPKGAELKALSLRTPSYTRVSSQTSMKSPSASKPGRILGLDDMPETSTFHTGPSKPMFIT